MYKIKIKRRVTRDALSQLASKLFESPPVDEEIVVSLPQKLQYGGALGSEADLIQLLITIRQCFGSFYISTYASDKSPDTWIEQLSGQAYGIAAIYLADGLQTSNRQFIERSTLFRYVSPHIEAIEASDYRNSAKGIGANLLMMRGAKKEYPAPFYNMNRPPLRDADAIYHEVCRILQTMGVMKPQKTRNFPIADNVATAIHELVENIDDHATYDLDKKRISRNLRGVMFRSHLLDTVQLAGATKHAGPASEFARYSALFAASTTGITSKFRVLEISIFDSGVGMASRWHGVPPFQLTHAYQERAIEECFKKNTSTKPEIKGSGQGLYRLQKAAQSCHGAIEIRTGNVTLTKRFSRNEDIENGVRWLGGDESHPYVSGTRISVLLPLP